MASERIGTAARGFIFAYNDDTAARGFTVQKPLHAVSILSTKPLHVVLYEAIARGFTVY